MTRPLDGVRVVDTTIARSGPTCSRQLADMGADVIVVGRGRFSLGGSDEMNLSRNKRSVTLDLKKTAGVARCWLSSIRPTCSSRIGGRESNTV